MSCTSGRLLVRRGRVGKAGSAAASSYSLFLISFNPACPAQHLPFFLSAAP